MDDCFQGTRLTLFTSPDAACTVLSTWGLGRALLVHFTAGTEVVFETLVLVTVFLRFNMMLSVVIEHKITIVMLHTRSRQ